MRSRKILLTGLLASAAVAGAVPIIQATGAPDQLPDLVADAPENPVIGEYRYPDGHKALMVRFDGFIDNIGSGPLEIRGSSPSGTGGEMTFTRQYVNGAPLDPPPVGPPRIHYEANDDHNHWHLDRIARYSLWNEARTAEVAPGQKVGFCLEDVEKVNPAAGDPVYTDEYVDGFCRQGYPNAANVKMGVSPGWRDTYGWWLAFQWVDVSAVQPGTYYLASQVDQNNVVLESNETNNSIETPTFMATPIVVPGYVANAVSVTVPPSGGSVTFAATKVGNPTFARRFRIESLPDHGVLTSGGVTLAVGDSTGGSTVTYVPDAGYTGPDSFRFSATQLGQGGNYPTSPAQATASITVGEAPAATIGISGLPATLLAGTSAQLTATVTNAGPAVTWSVDGVQGGNSTVGTISADGLYVAPAQVPAGETVRIRATSVEQPGVFSEVQVRILVPPTPQPAPVLVTPSVPLSSATPASPASPASPPAAPGATGTPAATRLALLGAVAQRVQRTVVVQATPSKNATVSFTAVRRAGGRWKVVGRCRATLPASRLLTCRMPLRGLSVRGLRVRVVATGGGERVVRTLRVIA
ncbi:MAG: lysyl oxidase family protein [Actinomycetota bacterium]